MSTTQFRVINELPAPIEIQAMCAGPERPALRKVYIKDGWAWATDSFGLARVALLDERGDQQLPAEALSAARRKTSYLPMEDHNGTIIVIREGKEDLEVPNYACQGPNFEQLWRGAVDDRDDLDFSFGIDAKRLYDLARAIGADRGTTSCTVRITISTTAPNRPMRVEPLKANGAEGILMPVRLT